MSDPIEYSAPRPSETPEAPPSTPRTPRQKDVSISAPRNRKKKTPRVQSTKERFPLSSAMLSQQKTSADRSALPSERQWVFFASLDGAHLTFTSAGIIPSDIEIPFAGNLPPDGLKPGDIIIDSKGDDWKVVRRLVFLTLARSRPAKSVYLLEPVLTAEDLEALSQSELPIS